MFRMQKEIKKRAGGLVTRSGSRSGNGGSGCDDCWGGSGCGGGEWLECWSIGRGDGVAVFEREGASSVDAEHAAAVA